jgi:hypothetical protein
MNGDDHRRRAVTAQGFAALALFVFAHGAHAATVPPHAQPASLGHGPAMCQPVPA